MAYGAGNIGNYGYIGEMLKKRQQQVTTQAQPAQAPAAPPTVAPPTLQEQQSRAQSDIMKNAPMANTQQIADMRAKFFQSQRDIANQDIARQRADAFRAQNQQQDEAQDMIRRRFASMGAGGSGAEIAALAKLNEQGLAGQRDINDRIGAGVLDNLRSQEQNAELQQALAGRDELFKRELAGTDQANKLAQLDMAMKQFEIDKDTTAFNRRMAEIEYGANTNATRRARAGLLGQGGFLGTGLGAEGGLLGTGLLSGGK